MVFMSCGLAPLLPITCPSAFGEHATASLTVFLSGGLIDAIAGLLRAPHDGSLCGEPCCHGLLLVGRDLSISWAALVRDVLVEAAAIPLVPLVGIFYDVQ